MRARQNLVVTLRAAVTGRTAGAIAVGAAAVVALGLGVAAVAVGGRSGPGERAAPGGSDADAALLIPRDGGPDEAAPAQPVELDLPTDLSGADDRAAPAGTSDSVALVEPAVSPDVIAGPEPGTSVTSTSTTTPSTTATTTPPGGSDSLLDAVARLLGGP